MIRKVRYWVKEAVVMVFVLILLFTYPKEFTDVMREVRGEYE